MGMATKMPFSSVPLSKIYKRTAEHSLLRRRVVELYAGDVNSPAKFESAALIGYTR